MLKIGKVIFPDRDVDITLVQKKSGAIGTGELKYSPAMQGLVNEHTVIKKVLAMIPSIIEELDVSCTEDETLVLDTIDFIRSYADKYHHAKEEDILFKEFDVNLDLVKVFNEDHKIGRGHVKAILDALAKQDNQSIRDHFMGYRYLLNGHIKREDEVLYRWMDRNISTSQIVRLFARFVTVDEQFKEVRTKQEAFVKKLEAIHQYEEV